jgi:hypothetical protein
MYPKKPPTAPPIICVRFETLSTTNKASNTCSPIYRMETKINVRGIVPFLKLVKDDRIIKAKTTPLAPSSPYDGNRI